MKTVIAVLANISSIVLSFWSLSIICIYNRYLSICKSCCCSISGVTGGGGGVVVLGKQLISTSSYVTIIERTKSLRIPLPKLLVENSDPKYP